jgi:hypothetical protein
MYFVLYNELVFNHQCFLPSLLPKYSTKAFTRSAYLLAPWLITAVGILPFGSTQDTTTTDVY